MPPSNWQPVSGSAAAPSPWARLVVGGWWWTGYNGHMTTNQPPYVAVIFSATRTLDDDEGYDAMATRMVRLAREQPGYLGIESVRDPITRDGITVSYWATEDDARAWKQVAEHLGAQQLGRDRWYSTYRTRVAIVTREYGWPDRPS